MSDTKGKRPEPLTGEQRFNRFVRWWWEHRREEMVAWLRDRTRFYIPKSARAAYRQAGGQLKNF